MVPAVAASAIAPAIAAPPATQPPKQNATMPRMARMIAQTTLPGLTFLSISGGGGPPTPAPASPGTTGLLQGGAPPQLVGATGATALQPRLSRLVWNHSTSHAMA